MTALQQEIDRLRTLQESLSDLTSSYEQLSEGMGDMVLMTNDEYQPALEDLLNQLN